MRGTLWLVVKPKVFLLHEPRATPREPNFLGSGHFLRQTVGSIFHLKNIGFGENVIFPPKYTISENGRTILNVNEINYNCPPQAKNLRIYNF